MAVFRGSLQFFRYDLTDQLFQHIGLLFCVDPGDDLLIDGSGVHAVQGFPRLRSSSRSRLNRRESRLTFIFSRPYAKPVRTGTHSPLRWRRCPRRSLRGRRHKPEVADQTASAAQHMEPHKSGVVLMLPQDAEDLAHILCGGFPDGSQISSRISAVPNRSTRLMMASSTVAWWSA